ncbi:unnamed protein product [Trifolium pratense]|uniref:Uncharacterized protein n=1 Tax=Trifolium pratense TaxID=57577 RepID=A0ACB0M8X0_TRIPR|nr:unnamed protein product [Trifolium pratense]
MPSASTFLLDCSSKVPLSLRQRLEEASRLFFAQSLEELKKVERDEINPSGYYDSQHTKSFTSTPFKRQNRSTKTINNTSRWIILQSIQQLLSIHLLPFSKTLKFKSHRLVRRKHPAVIHRLNRIKNNNRLRLDFIAEMTTLYLNDECLLQQMSLHLQQVALARVDHFYISFGLLAFGLYGRSETIDCSHDQQIHPIFCWTRSSFSLLVDFLLQTGKEAKENWFYEPLSVDLTSLHRFYPVRNRANCLLGLVNRQFQAHEKMIPPDNKRGRRDSNEDRLSDLPDCVLLHILSFLNSKHAVQTCVLSPRWKLLWKCIPTLILHSSEFSNAKKLGIFVTKILNLRDTTPSLHTLDFERLGSFEPQRTLKEIINYACSHNTQLKKLGICVKGLYSNGKRTLFPKYLNLPALTSLDLTYFTFCASDNADHAEPFSSFNCLNNLIISSCTVTDAPILRISSATLVNLTMSYNSSDFPKFELFAPSLYTITFEGVPHQRLCGSSLSSIKQVNIEADIFSNRFEELPFVLFSWQQDLINIKSLTVAATNLKILSLVPDLFKAKLPSLLCNLKTLKVCSRLTWLTKIRLTFDKSSNEDTVEKSQANTRSLPQDNGL